MKKRNLVEGAPGGGGRSMQAPIGTKGSEVIIVVLLAESNRDEFRPNARCLGRITIDSSNDSRIAQSIFDAIGAGARGANEPTSGELLASLARALEPRGDSNLSAWSNDDASIHFANLTPRQREIMERVLAGHPNKIIAADLGISQRTVENHRASIMRKTGAKSLPALVRMAMVAGKTGFPALTSH
jgi:DNA-binding NarL/FixJ family response regulator